MEPYAAEAVTGSRWAGAVRPLAAFVAVVLVAGIASALLVDGGDGAGTSDEVAVDTLRPAADTLEAVESLRLRMTFHVKGDGLSFDVGGEGLIDNRSGVGEFRLGLPCGDARFVSTGSVIYLRGPSAPGWTRVDMGAVQVPGQNLQGAPLDPQQVLDSLRTVGEVERVGEEDVGGVTTTHYRATGDVESIVPDEQAALLDALRGEGEPQVAIEAWIDDEGLARRMESTVEASGFSFSFRLDLDRFDEPVEVSVPADDDIAADHTVTSMAELTTIGATMGADCAMAPPVPSG